MRQRALLIVLLAALVAMPLAGCGGSPDETGAAATAVTKEKTEAVSESEPAQEAEPVIATDTPEPETETAEEDETEESEAEEPSAETARGALQDLDSYRQTATLRSTTDDDVDETQVLLEYVREPQATRLVLTQVDSAGEPVSESEIIQIGNTTYIRTQEVGEEPGEWATFASDEASESGELPGALDWMASSDYFEGSSSCDRKGREDVAGQPATLYECDKGVFVPEEVDLTGKLVEGSAKTWISEEYRVPVRSIINYATEDEDGVRYEFYYEMTVTDVNVPITIEAPEGVEAPGLPEDVPLYPEANITTAMTGMVIFEAEAETADVLDFYREEMEAEGWTLDSDMEDMLTYAKEGRSVWIMVEAKDGMVEGSIMIQ